MNYNDCDVKCTPTYESIDTDDFLVEATIKEDYWVEDIKRYVIPNMSFIKGDEVYNKPFISETANIEFHIYRMYEVVDVLRFQPFDSIVISKKVVSHEMV